MKLYKIIGSYDALKQIAKCPLSKQDLYRVDRIISKAKENLRFYLEQSERCTDQAQRLALLEVDVEMPEAVTLEMPDDIRLSVADIENLRGMIDLTFNSVGG